MSELGKHRKKAFLRNPMFGLNLGVRIFMILIFGMLASEMLVFGFVLDKLLLEVGEYTRAIDTFNSILVYIFLLDFLLKFFIKRNNSMRIMPYLTLPIPRKKLFDFLLKKEFYSFWNLYLLFLVVPFSFMAIAPFHGILLTFAYIIFFYSICIGNSLLVNFINNLIGRKWWTKLIAAIIVAGIVFLGFDPQINYGDWTVSIGDAFFKWNPLVWLIQLGIVFGLWTLNRKQMRNAVYSELQGNKKDKISKITGFSFFDRFGEIGEFMNLDIKMIFRSKRLRQQIYTGVFFVIFYFIIVYSGENNPILHSFFYKLFFMLFCLGYLGLIMGQYLFTSESSFFDGLMARNKSLMPMLMGKYFLYVGYATVTLPILAIPAFHDKYSFLFLFSSYFFTIGVYFLLIFQNAVFNKSFFDLSEGGMMNWKGISANMMWVTMLAMFVPLALLIFIGMVWGENIACYIMLATGIIATLTVKYWMQWTYNRFLKRKYKNMEGFRTQ